MTLQRVGFFCAVGLLFSTLVFTVGGRPQHAVVSACLSFAVLVATAFLPPPRRRTPSA